MNYEPTIHVIDDEAAMRRSLQMLLQTEGYSVRTYPLARDFLDGVATAEKGCVITDVRMPDMTGIQLLDRLNKLNRLMPVIVITAFADVPLAVEAMKLGAVDFIEKPFTDRPLFEAVRAALALTGEGMAHDANVLEISERLATLSSREKDVLTALVKGLQNKVIAFELGISVRTVESHRANLMTKMKADSLSQLVRMALLASAAATKA